MLRCLCVILILEVVWGEGKVDVVTSKGIVRGQRASDGNYSTFFGIPYANVKKDNPFGDSENYPHFDTPFDASDSSIRCPQVILKEGGIQQCLRLNIYVPDTAKINKPVPVFVWFHGGGFVFGSAGEYGGQYLVQHDIIVVTANYRLGPYGFLCLDNDQVPGNQGLKDQIEALRWVKKNIHAFGGDSSKVTIAGESYGGGAVDFHLYSSYETLFDKAIIQSGTMYAEGIFAVSDCEAPVKLAKQLGHNVTDMNQAMEFLTKDDPIEVMRATRNLSLLPRPCGEKIFRRNHNFMTTDTLHLKSTRIKNTPILIGYNSNEDIGSFVNQPDEFYKALGNFFLEKLRRNIILPERKMEELADQLKNLYLGSKNISKEAMLELSHFSADTLLTSGAERSVENYVRQGAPKVYKYVFSYIGGSQYKNITGAGAHHTEELKYLFDTGSELTSDEQRLMRARMTTMWANFVKFGDPTPASNALLPVKWQPINNDSLPYLNIDINIEMTDQKLPKVDYWMNFWRNYENSSIFLVKRSQCPCK